MSEGLAVSAARGVMWTGAGQVIRQVVQIVSSIVLARLLVPEEFGLLGMALFFVGFAQLLADFGLGAAIVHGQHDDPDVLSSCFWFSVLVSAGLSLVVALLAKPISMFYGEPIIAGIVLVLSVNLLITGAQAVPQASLQRDMRFGDLAKSQVFGGICGAFTAVVMAAFGGGVWSLVMQPLVGSCVTFSLLLYYSRWAPSLRLKKAEFGPLMLFSGHVLGSNLLTYVTRNSDQVLIGRFLGQQSLGLYSLAYQLMLYPLQHVSSVIVRVLFPTLSQIKGDLERFASAYLRAIGVIAFLTFPMMMGLFAVAEDFIAVVFGEKWSAMLPVLKMFTGVGLFQSIGTTVGTIYLASGRTDLMLKVVGGVAPVVVIAVIAGLPWGVTGVAMSYAIAAAAMFYVTLYFALGVARISFRRFHAHLIRPFMAALIMTASVILLREFMVGFSPAMRLVLCISLGALVYPVMSFVLNRQQIQEIWILLNRVLHKQGA